MVFYRKAVKVLGSSSVGRKWNMYVVDEVVP